MESNDRNLLVSLILLCPVVLLTETMQAGLILGCSVFLLLTAATLVAGILPLPALLRRGAALLTVGLITTGIVYFIEQRLPLVYYTMEGGLACMAAAAFYCIQGTGKTDQPLHTQVFGAMLKGLCYCALVTAFSGFRELLSDGTLMGVPLTALHLQFFAQPSAGFFLLAVMAAAGNRLLYRRQQRRTK